MTCTRVYGALHPTTVEALIAVCIVMRPCKQKDLVLHFYELLVLTQKMNNETKGPNASNSAIIQSGLDELFRRVPAEWHPDMLAVQYVSHASLLCSRFLTNAQDETSFHNLLFTYQSDTTDSRSQSWRRVRTTQRTRYGRSKGRTYEFRA